jgi:hypothetical protein
MLPCCHGSQVHGKGKNKGGQQKIVAMAQWPHFKTILVSNILSQ